MDSKQGKSGQRRYTDRGKKILTMLQPGLLCAETDILSETGDAVNARGVFREVYFTRGKIHLSQNGREHCEKYRVSTTSFIDLA